MFEIIRKIWQTGVVTHKLPLEEAPQRYRGKLALQPDKCNRCGACVKACPAKAIEIQEYEIIVSYAACIFCGLCTKACERKAVFLTNDYHLSATNKNDLVQAGRISRA